MPVISTMESRRRADSSLSRGWDPNTAACEVDSGYHAEGRKRNGFAAHVQLRSAGFAPAGLPPLSPATAAGTRSRQYRRFSPAGSPHSRCRRFGPRRRAGSRGGFCVHRQAVGTEFELHDRRRARLRAQPAGRPRTSRRAVQPCGNMGDFDTLCPEVDEKQAAPGYQLIRPSRNSSKRIGRAGECPEFSVPDRGSAR